MSALAPGAVTHNGARGVPLLNGAAKNPEPQRDKAAAARFLKLLDENADTHTFQTFTDAKPKPNPDPLAECRTGTLDEVWNWLCIQSMRGAGVFVTVNKTDGKGRKAENITGIRAVWQEDDGEGKPLPLEPHIVVETSPGKFHRYILCEGLSVEDHRRVQDVLIDQYGSDRNAGDVSRVLRLPGFLHCKGKAHLVRIVSESGAQPYSAAQVVAAFPPSANAKVTPAPTSASTATEHATPEQITHLRSALAFMRADLRDDFIANGARLRGLGDVGRGLWIDWAMSSTKWQPSDAQTWETLDHDRTGYAAIFKEAQTRGWLNPASKVVQSAASSAVTGSALRIVPIGDLHSATLEPPRYAVEPIIPAGLVTLLGAHGGTGKSMLALVIAAHFAASRPWGPFAMSGGAAVFVSLEDPAKTVLYRLRLIVDEYGLDSATVTENLRIVDGSGGDGALANEVAAFGVRSLNETANMPVLRELIGAAKLIVIDNASDGFDGNENDRRIVRAFVRMLAQIARDNDAGLLLLAHIDKDAAKNGARGNSYSGSTAWHNSARSRLALTVQDGGIELWQEKLNLGKCAEPLALRWSLTGVLVPGEARASDADQASAALIASADAKGLLAAFRAAADAGVNVPTGRTGPSTTQSVLATFPALPASLRKAQGRERFWAALARLQREGCVSSEEYIDESRHKRKRFAVNDAAVACVRLSPIPPANERAQIARHAPVCDGSETPAELPQTPA